MSTPTHEETRRLAAAVRGVAEQLGKARELLIDVGPTLTTAGGAELAKTCRALAEQMVDQVELIRTLARMVEGKTVYQAFGAPGDWGYGTPIGDALRGYLNNPPASETAADQVKRLQAIVAELPKTAEGKPITPGAVVYDHKGNEIEVGYVGVDGFVGTDQDGPIHGEDLHTAPPAGDQAKGDE